MPDTVTILVTGFGPFEGARPSNLSYAIVTTLPTYLAPTPHCQTAVRIIVHPYDIPMSYSEVQMIVPRLYDAHEQDVDIWLHLGAAADRSSYTIEKLGHRDGYDVHRDISGQILDAVHAQNHWADCPAVLETSLPFDDLFTRWRSSLLDSPNASSELAGVMIRASSDPGHFICDFIYYSSLAEHWKRRNNGTVRNKVAERPVMFMHVPALHTQDQLRKGRAVTIKLVQALAETWRLSKSNGETDANA